MVICTCQQDGDIRISNRICPKHGIVAHPKEEEMGSGKADDRALARVFSSVPVTLDGTNSEEVIDVRGMRGFKALLGAAGAGTYIECDEDGVAMVGGTEEDIVGGAFVAADWPFYLITRSAGVLTVAVV